MCRISQGNLAIDRQFTGQILDSTGLYYYNARYYDPTIGRFISADTEGIQVNNPQTLNRYSYCANNPLNRTDPGGKDYISEHGGPHLPPNPPQVPPVQSLPNLPISKSSSPIIVSVGAGAAGFWGDITGIWDNLPDPAKVVIGTVAGVLGAEISIPIVLTGVLVICGAVCLTIPGDSPNHFPEYPGNDGTKSPGKNWEWRGQPGSQPGDAEGNYYDPKTGEVLRPDVGHPDPEGPHWDYRDPAGKWWRLNPDGSATPKP